MGNSIIGRSWSSVKLFIEQNYTENANGDMPLMVENVWFFQFLWVQGARMFFLYKRYFYYMTIIFIQLR